MTNRRKIAAKRVFVVFGNDDVQTGFQRFCVIACGSECRRFESVRAPFKENPCKSSTCRDFQFPHLPILMEH